MKQKFPHLFSSIRIGNVTFRNRIFASPTSNPAVSNPPYLAKEVRAFYELRAKGGAAVVTLGDSIVDSETGRTHDYKIFMDDSKIIPSLSAAARDIRRHGAVPSLELTHGGKFANVPNLINPERTNRIPYGPVHELNQDGIEIFEMPEDVILRVVEAFGKAAARAKMAGFEMIAIHGGHGWFIHQFMSPATNHRKDRFGGSRENRLRLATMIVESVRKAVGPNFPIEFRMSGAEFSEGGYDLAEGVEIAKLLAPHIDLLQVSAGIHDNPDTFVITHPSMFRDHGCNVFLAAEIKKHVNIPVATLGGLSDPAMMEEIIASGKADIVEMSRALIADPYLPQKAMLGREDDIVKCIRCFTCMHCLRTTRDYKCALNPIIGRELDYFTYNTLPGASKNVLVAGGGPGGMYAAVTAAERGHRVTLFEASGRLGGQLNNEEHIPFKKDLFDFVGVLERRIARAGVEVKLNARLTPELAESLKPDAIIAAVGAEYILPAIQGIEGKNVRFLPALREKSDVFGKSVLVLGGGLVGCETAIHLFNQGKEVTIIEMLDDYATDAPYFHKEAIRTQLELGIPIKLNTRAVRVTNEGLVCTDKDGEEVLFKADTVFCAVGMNPRLDEVEALRFCAPQFFTVGDCIRPGQVTQAVSDGYYAAIDL